MAPLQFGALVFDYQVIDVIGITDLINSSTKDAISAWSYLMPIDDAVVARAPEIVFHHIGATTTDPVHLLTSHLTIVPTTTVDECPELDILLVGGPNPFGFELHPKFADLIRRHVAAGKLLFTNCTGAAIAASTGALDGRAATVNHAAFNYSKKEYPNVKWTNEKKFVVDGNVWTGSGAVAGMDMAAHWVKENYGMEVLINGAMAIDFEPRDENGHLNVIPKRYNAEGVQISTHEFPQKEL